MEKIVILGSGCAGWTAALYAARASLAPRVFGGNDTGGQLSLTTAVENFPGFPEGIQGPELVERMKKQALHFGARYVEDTVTKIESVDGGYRLIAGKETVEAKTVIIATGASARWLGLESEKRYIGHGVSSCATCDGFFAKDMDVIVVGGGDSACEEGLFLTKFARKVTLVHRRDKLRASKIMQERVLQHEKMDVIWDTVVEEVLGDGMKVTGVKLKNVRTGEVREKPVGFLFVAIGHVPNTKPFEGVLELDAKGYLVADRTMQSSLPGVFAAGDVTDTRYRQAVTAAGMGCMAAMEAERFLENQRG